MTILKMAAKETTGHQTCLPMVLRELRYIVTMGESKQMNHLIK